MKQPAVIFYSEILEMKDNNLAAYLFDTDGNTIEIVQIMPDSPSPSIRKDFIVVYKNKILINILLEGTIATTRKQ